MSKAIKGEAKKEKKDDVEINPKMDDMREKVQIPDKMKAKMDKIVKALNKSVGAHAKQAKTISKMTGMDKPDVQERKLTDKEMKKREDVAQAIKRDDPDMPMDKKMAIATSVAKKTKGEDVEEKYTPAQIKMAHGIANHPRYKAGDHTGAMKAIEKIKKGLSLHPTVQKHLKKANEDIIRRGDAKVVKVKGPDGKPMFKKMKPVVKVDDPADHAMKAEETVAQTAGGHTVGKDNGYTFSIFQTKSILHGLGQVRDRTFYFFWKDDKVPLFDYVLKKPKTIEDEILEVERKDDDPMSQILTNDRIPSEEPYYKYVLEVLEDTVSHICDDKKLSGLKVYTFIREFATLKLQEFPEPFSIEVD